MVQIVAALVMASTGQVTLGEAWANQQQGRAEWLI